MTGMRKHGTQAIVLLAALAGLLATEPASAQGARGLAFVGGLGYQSGGPGQDLVDALARGGLDDIRPGTCAGSICQDSVDFPFHFRDGIGLAVTLGARYRFHAPVSVEMVVANGQRGHAEGYREQPLQQHMTVSYSSYVLGSTVGAHVGPLRLGLGPALLLTSWSAVQNAAVTESSSSSTFGGMAAVSYSVRLPGTVLSLRASAQRFGPARVPNPMQIPIEADYRSYELGITVNPRAD